MFTKERFVHYKTGIPEHDADHWKLFCMMNDANRCCTSSEFECMRDTLNDILHFYIEHSKMEEDHMRDNNYPFISHHTDLHTTLKSELLKLIVGTTKTIYASKDLTHIFEEHFLAHIESQDIQYSNWYHQEQRKIGLVV